MDCVSHVGNLAGTVSLKSYACYAVCQNATLFPGTRTPVTDFAAKCLTCIKNPALEVAACTQW